VIAVEPEVSDVIFPCHGQALHRIDLVVQQVETANVRQARERVRPDYAQVRVLDGQHMHMAETAKRERLQ